MKMSDTNYTPERSTAIEPVPLTVSKTKEMLEADEVETVWIPQKRVENVITLDGKHEGDILNFWVETKTSYVKYNYEPGESDSLLAWHKYKPTMKDGNDAGMIKEVITDDYVSVREVDNE